MAAERTPAEDAAWTLLQRYKKELERWSDAEVIFFADYCEDWWDSLVRSARSEVRCVAAVVGRAELRRRKARDKLWAEAPDPRQTEERQEELQAVERAFKVEVLSGLQIVNSLTDNQRFVLQGPRGLDLGYDLPTRADLRRKMREVVAPQPDNRAIWHAAKLLMPP